MPAQQVSTAVPREQREQFDRDGYLKFDPEIPEEVLDRVVSDLSGHYSFEDTGQEVDELGVSYTSGPNPRVQYAWKISEAVHQVALAPKVLSVLEALYGRRPKPSQTLNFMTGTEQAAHVDGMYFNSEPQGWMCGVWVALEDIDMDNGPLIYYPGSHKLPLPTWDDLGGEPKRSDFDSEDKWLTARVTIYQNYVASQIERYGREPEYGTMEKGQALIWSAHLIHGGSPQRDRNRTRHSQVTHYYFEGDDLRVAWPLGKEGDRMAFTYPAWISWDAPKRVTPEVVRESVEAHVPPGATVLLDTGGWNDLLDVGDRTAWPFPQRDGHYVPGHEISGEQAIDALEQLKEEGASYLVVPGGAPITVLAARHFRDLQNHLESRYSTVLRDGGRAVIFKLDG